MPRISAVGDHIAIAAIQTSLTTATYYITTDGGARWSSMTAISF